MSNQEAPPTTTTVGPPILALLASPLAGPAAAAGTAAAASGTGQRAIRGCRPEKLGPLQEDSRMARPRPDRDTTQLCWLASLVCRVCRAFRRSRRCQRVQFFAVFATVPRRLRPTAGLVGLSYTTAARRQERHREARSSTACCSRKGR